MTINTITAKFARLTTDSRKAVAEWAGKFLDAFAAQDWRMADISYGEITCYLPLGGSQPSSKDVWDFLYSIAE